MPGPPIPSALIVTGNSVDLIGSYWEATPNGGHTIDLDGNGAGGISQSVTLADGEYQYELLPWR